MRESECRHLPAPVFNPTRCSKCGATLREPPDARLLAVAKNAFDWFCGGDSAAMEIRAELHDAIADAERGRPAWTGERPTVPGWYWVHREPEHVDLSRFSPIQIEYMVPKDWDGYSFLGPLAPPPAPGGEHER